MNPNNLDRVLEIIRRFPPLKERYPEFKRPARVIGGEAPYDWLINDWMPNQKDFDTLAELTILLEFNMPAVVAALMGETRFNQFISNEP